jgi:DNA modification methylase
MSWEIRQGRNLDRLAEMPDESVQTCITSPPYWGLRDYGTATWDGGDSECDHLAGPLASDKSKLNSGKGPAETDKVRTFGVPFRDGRCGKCGATRTDSQLGLEATPEEYVENMVKVFREVRRVLRDDGTLWLNLGDSYMGGGGGNYGSGISTASDHGQHLTNVRNRRAFIENTGLKPKDLVGIPWRVAFALQADGWYLRSDIIWHKPNPMPESVTDRPTKAHEYLFLLTKSPRYYYDADAIREVAVVHDRAEGRIKPGGDYELGAGRNDFATERSTTKGFGANEAGRNKRTVWTVTTKPFSGAHFAVFPPDLIEPCVLAGCPEGGIVLDPFSGSGTTGMVALRHDRSYIGLELNPEYAEMSRNRIRDDAPLLNTGQEVAA